MPKQRRVVVTGMGAVTPLGFTVADTWNNLILGMSGVDPITAFDAKGLKFNTTIAAEVQDFTLTAEPWNVEAKDVKRLDRFAQFALAAAIEAGAQAGLIPFDYSECQIDSYLLEDTQRERYRIGASVGSGMGGLITLTAEHGRLLRGIREGNRPTVSALAIPMLMVNAASAAVARYFGLWGVNCSTVSACASGTDAIIAAVDKIRLGKVDMVLAGAGEAVITPLAVMMFERMRALSPRMSPDASRPFDEERDGFVMGEGGVVLVLEELEHAGRRGASVLAEILGYGQTCDASHLTEPLADGSHAAQAMQLALEDADIAPHEVSYLNAHATATPLGDVAEIAAILKTFGEHAHALPVSSTKGHTGHLLGAAGPLELIFCVLALLDGVVPPTRNLHTRTIDENCRGVLHICGGPQYLPPGSRYAMSNSFGFGGSNSSVVVGLVD